MDSLIVRGGHRLDGTLRASGSKNAALPIMAATLLTQGVCQLERIPVLRDIATMLTLLSSLGATVSRAADGGVLVDSNQACEVRAPYDLVKTMRASILVLGPLLARHGKAAVSFPGGCAIGSRPVDLHIQALEAMGATISIEGGYLVAEAPQGLVGTEFTFDVVTVGGTENAVMAASLATGTTVLRNVAREPEIVDLVRFLRSMGADITGGRHRDAHHPGGASAHRGNLLGNARQNRGRHLSGGCRSHWGQGANDGYRPQRLRRHHGQVAQCRGIGLGGR